MQLNAIDKSQALVKTQPNKMVNNMAKLSKVQRTDNLINRELAKVDGDYNQLDRARILKTMKRTMNMSDAYANTYYHSSVKKHKEHHVD